MAAPQRYRAILSILNEDFTTYSGKPWWLDSDLRLGTFTENEARLISEDAPSGFAHRVAPGQKCVHLIGLPKGKYSQIRATQESQVQLVAMSAQVTFNLLAERHPVVIPYAVVIGEGTTMRLKDVYEFEIWGNPLSLREQKYRIKAGIDKLEFRYLFGIIRAVISKVPSLQITVNRFCSALLKTNNEDKLIDLTIALESLIPGGGEFGFRFPFYLSLLVEREPDKRKQAYSRLKALYNARSGLVHGATDKTKEKDLKVSIANWPHLVTYAKQCIIYRLRFADSANLKWQDHLLDIAYSGKSIM